MPNGSRLSCGRLARRRKAVRRKSVPRQGHNTPLPLKRSAPASFKRLLGAIFSFQSDLLLPGARAITDEANVPRRYEERERSRQQGPRRLEKQDSERKTVGDRKEHRRNASCLRDHALALSTIGVVLDQEALLALPLTSL